MACEVAAKRWFTLGVVTVAFAAIAAGEERLVFRSVSDPAEGRKYVLLRNGLEVLGNGGQGQGQRIELPGWIWAGEPYSCPPGIALAPGGDVLVTSNVMPVIWRIDRKTQRVTIHRLTLAHDRHREVGFTHLRWSGELDAYLGTTDLGERWHIDRALARARKLSGIEPSARQLDCGEGGA